MLLVQALIICYLAVYQVVSQGENFKLREYSNVQSSKYYLHWGAYVPSDINYTVTYSYGYDGNTSISDIFIIFGLTDYQMDNHLYTQQFQMSLTDKNQTHFKINVKAVNLTLIVRLGISYLSIAKNEKNNIGMQYHSYIQPQLYPLNETVAVATIRQKWFYEPIIDSRISGKLLINNFKVGIVLMGFYQRTDNGFNITLKASIFNETTVLIKIGVGFQTRLLKTTFSLYLYSNDYSLASNPAQNLMLVQSSNIQFTPSKTTHLLTRNSQNLSSIDFFFGISSFYVSRRDTKLNLQIYYLYETDNATQQSITLYVNFNGQYLNQMDCLLVYIGKKICLNGIWFNKSLQYCIEGSFCPENYVRYYDQNYQSSFCAYCEVNNSYYYFNFSSLECVQNNYKYYLSDGLIAVAIVIPIVIITIIGGSIAFYCCKRKKDMQKVKNRTQFDLRSIKIVPDIGM